MGTRRRGHYCSIKIHGSDAARLLQFRRDAAWAPCSSADFRPARAQQIDPSPNERNERFKPKFSSPQGDTGQIAGTVRKGETVRKGGIGQHVGAG